VNARIPSPLVGFNNNVRYRGMNFHIQTEDSGIGRPHIITHLFADGGRVIKTLRVDYSEHVSKPDYRTTVQLMMRDQHKEMAYDLRRGKIDAIIDKLALRPPAKDGKRSLRPGQASEHPERSATSPPVADIAASASLPPSSEARAVPVSDPVRSRPMRTRSGVFSAVPSVSLDEMILGYVTRSPG
jgi:hypothetical protein